MQRPIDVEPCPSCCDDLKIIAAIQVLSVIEKVVTYLASPADTRDRFAAMSSDLFMSPLGRDVELVDSKTGRSARVVSNGCCRRWPRTDSPGHDLTMATGRYLASPRVDLAADATAR